MSTHDPSIASLPEVYLFDAVLRLERALTRIGNLRLRRWDITLSSYTALRVLEQRSDLSLSELSRRCHVRPQSMTRMIGDLEHRGFVRRAATTSKRAPLSLALTESGVAELREMDREVMRINNAITHAMTISQASDLEATLRACAKIIEEEADETP